MKSKKYFTYNVIMKIGIFFLVLIFIIILLSSIYNKDRKSLNTQAEEKITEFNTGDIQLNKLTDNGGRVSWYKGTAHSLIAYDAVVNKFNKNTEVFTIDPATKATTCVTCGENIPTGFVGQAEWHTNGEYLIIQVENENSKHGVFNHLAWGIDNDLWIVKKDGSDAKKIWDTQAGYSVLHPHFNKDGTKLIFAERVPTGKQILGGKLAGTPGGENQWDGWRIHIADFNLSSSEILSNHKTIFDNTSGVYETHGFYNDQIIFTHTPAGRAYMDDIFMANIDGTNIQKLTDNSKTWDEHGHFSPVDDSIMAYMSSNPFPNWDGKKGGTAQTLQTELFMKNVVSGKTVQLTKLNETMGKNVVVSDFDWNADGTQIVFQVAEIKAGSIPELWILSFNQ